jgi:hypothetical protein
MRFCKTLRERAAWADGFVARAAASRLNIRFAHVNLSETPFSLGLPQLPNAGATQGGTSLRALGPICRVRTRYLLTDKLLD